VDEERLDEVRAMLQPLVDWVEECPDFQWLVSRKTGMAHAFEAENVLPFCGLVGPSRAEASALGDEAPTGKRCRVCLRNASAQKREEGT
jgi:hypothetical protein